MGASLGGGSGWDTEDGEFRPVSDINVTPLVDVMLVLLIIFMVAAPMMTVGVPVQLPKTAAAKPAEEKKPTVVSIDKDGKVFLAEEEIPNDEALLSRLTTLANEDKEQVVLVRGDRTIPYGRIMEIMGQVSNAGFLKVSLIAEAAKGLPGPPAPGAPAPAEAPASPAPVAPAAPTPAAPGAASRTP
ncbi:protein TolR [Flaviflagellibacter deserti]|uniref:Protein TolR n=1 Tax=Flaviflagellibacter deserti TaxID=2267266 RepID=A0ABV9YWM5_9HYPH